MIRLVEELKGLASSKIDELKTFFSLMQLESRLAALSLVPLLFSLVMIFIVCLGLWLALMSLLTYCGFLLLDSVLYALMLTLIIHSAVLYGLFKYLQFNIHNMSFEKTRRYLFLREAPHVSKKRINQAHSPTRKKITTGRMRGAKT